MAQADFSFLPFGAGGIPANENAGTAFAAPRWYYGTAAPTTAAAPAAGYNLGDVVFNVNQSVGQPMGWVCTTGGSSFVFSAIGVAGGSLSSTVTATTGTLSPGTVGSAVILLNPATTGTYSLPEASAQTAGTSLKVINIAAGPVTLTPLGTDQYQGGNVAAITLFQNQGTVLAATGTTNWYNETQAPPFIVTNTTVPTQTLANGYRLTLLNFAQTGTASLPEASKNLAGVVQSFTNLNSTTVTLAPLASDNYNGGVAAITLTQYSSISITSDGSTHWYKVGA